MNRLQNQINQAISYGVKLGFDLCDIVDNHEESKSYIDDLQHKKKTFKNLDSNLLYNIFIDKYIEGDTVINGVDVKKYIYELCRETKPEFYSIYKVNDGRFLRKLIIKLLKDFGIFLDLNWIDVSNITDMSGLFEDLEFRGRLSEWNVSHVKNMCRMFRNTEFNNHSISKWNVSSCENMEEMFAISWFNCDLSGWDVSRCVNMQKMFACSQFKQDLSTWNVSSVRNMRSMFFGSQFNFPTGLSNWEISPMCNTESMFKMCYIDKKDMPKI